MTRPDPGRKEDSPPAGGLARLSARTWILAAGATTLAVVALVQGIRTPAPPSGTTPAAAFPNRLPPDVPSERPVAPPPPPLDGGYRRDVVRPRPVVNVGRDQPPAETDDKGADTGGDSDLARLRRTARRVLPEIFRMPPATAPVLSLPDPRPVGGGRAGSGIRADREPDAPPGPTLEEGFAPFGRLVKCALVNTLDSLTGRSEPIVALVTDPLEWNGRVILPAGTEVFGYARPDPLIDARGVGRLTDTGEWTLVLPADAGGENGRELVLRGRAVDRSELALTAGGHPQAWGPDDGSDGLTGYTISTLNDEELRLFSAVAVSGLASGAADVAEQRQSVPGIAGALGATEPAETAANLTASAAGQGATAVASEYAARIRQEISRHGVYVRVPAGKPFYLFVEQTIDLRAAAVGLHLPPARARPPASAVDATPAAAPSSPP